MHSSVFRNTFIMRDVLDEMRKQDNSLSSAVDVSSGVPMPARIAKFGKWMPDKSCAEISVPSHNMDFTLCADAQLDNKIDQQEEYRI